MVTFITPIENVRGLGKVISKFLKKDGEALVDDITRIAGSALMLHGATEDDVLELRAIIRSNVLDTLTLMCLDKIIDGLGEDGFSSTIVKIMSGQYDLNFIGRYSYIETVLTGEVCDKIIDYLDTFDIYTVLGNFLQIHIAQEHIAEEYRYALIDTISNLLRYGEFNMRDVISTTIVDRSSLVFFLRNIEEDNETEDK